MVIKLRKHIPRKYTDINVIRCILLNINDKVCTEYTDYKIDNTLYNAMLNALVENGIISLFDKAQPGITNSYFISDLVKYNEWARKGFYRPISDCIVPLLYFSTELMKHIPVTV